jgi:hypothetical protein
MDSSDVYFGVLAVLIIVMAIGAIFSMPALDRG